MCIGRSGGSASDHIYYFLIFIRKSGNHYNYLTTYSITYAHKKPFDKYMSILVIYNSTCACIFCICLKSYLFLYEPHHHRMSPEFVKWPCLSAVWTGELLSAVDVRVFQIIEFMIFALHLEWKIRKFWYFLLYAVP